MRHPRPEPGLPPEGAEGIALFGHRDYVGGMWDEIGRLQFEFLVAQGLQPHHVLLDVACGSLRAGVHLIPYLDAGNYLGVEKEPELVRAGLEEELAPEVREEKRPEILVTESFEFERLSRRPDFAVAQSLFTHLTPDVIRLCLARLAEVAPPHLRFFATFFEAPWWRRPRNPERSCATVAFEYRRRDMRELGQESGWSMRYVGEWGHPRGQRMLEYRRSPGG